MYQRLLLPLIFLIASVIGTCFLIAQIPEEQFIQRLMGEFLAAIISVLTGLIATYLVTIFTSTKKRSLRSFFLPWWGYFVIFLAAFVILFLIFFRVPSHYIVYTVDNSGSMGKCKSYDEDTGGCKLETDESLYPITKLNRILGGRFKKDKTLGSEDVPNLIRNVLGRRVVSKIKIGLVEVGGESSQGECNAYTLAIPKLNNRNELIEGLRNIEANDSGATALVQGLNKADVAIQTNLNKWWFNSSLSKNVIFFTDGDGDNCKKDVDFCTAAQRYLPRDFDIKLNLVVKGASCEAFKCSVYEYSSCKIVKDFSDEEVSQKIDDIQNAILAPKLSRIEDRDASSSQIINILGVSTIALSAILITLTIISNFPSFIGELRRLPSRSFKLIKDLVLLAIKPVKFQLPLLIIVIGIIALIALLL